MALAAATRLGPYEILGLIGAGGMGEVYKARDTRLDRTVAIKVLPADISNDPDRRARFEREAKTIATLSHPHICTLFDVGDHASSMFLVMEHLLGQTLADRIRNGPLPIEQALECGAQIAEALSAAHRAGIVHRDLKPANVMLTKSGVKLLDFGLAKLAACAGQAAVVSGMTHTQPLTGEGAILGTLQYMAPEQVEGKDTDARTDIWALGLVLYEMITARRAFEAQGSASLIAAILDREPPAISALQPETPPAFDHLTRKCLAKDPEARWQSASDIADELRWVASGSGTAGVASASARQARRQRWWMGTAVLGAAGLVVAVMALSWALGSGRSQPTRVSRLAIPFAEGLGAASEAAISPDGRAIAFASSHGQTSRLYLRRMDEWKIKPLAGTEGVTFSCFSPDGQSLAFASTKGIQIIRLNDDPPVRIYAGADVEPGMSWDQESGILFSRGTAHEGLWRVSPGGGRPELLARSDNASVRYLHPQSLPGGAVLFTILSQGRASVAVRDSGGKVRVVRENVSHARYLPATGHLVYQAEGHLFGVRFDLRRLSAVGDVAVVAEDVGNSDPLHSEYDVSATGTLVHLPPADTRLLWIDRRGARTPFWVEKRVQSGYVQLSPDGRSAVLALQRWQARQVFRVDLDRDVALTKLTPGDDNYYGVFTPDGQQVLFTSSDDRGGLSIFSMRAGGGGVPRPETSASGWQRATSVLRDREGLTFLFNDITGPDGGDIWQQRLGQPDTKHPAIKSGARELEAAFSPDGHWIAYQSDESGRPEIYVVGYPVGPKTRVSTDGGRNPVWNPKGGELFYAQSGGIVAVRVENGKRIGTPRALFERPVYGSRNWDVAPDGERFLVAENTRPAEISIVTNWFEELKAKVPGK